MTDPTTKTVRGWQVDILGALAGLAGLAGVASELSYLNKRLWGKDSTGAAIAPADAPPLVDAFIQSLTTPSGPSARAGILEYLFWRLGEADTTAIPNRLSRIADAAELTADRLYSGGARKSEAELSYDIRELVSALGGSLGLPVGGATANDSLAALVAAIGVLSSAPGGFTARDLLGRILVEQTRAADCCEDASSGDTAPAPDPTACGAGFDPPGPVSEYEPGDYSTAGVAQEGLALVPGSGSVLSDMAAPWAPSRRAFRVTGATSAFVCLQVTTAPGDTGQYGVSITGRLTDGTTAFTPGGFAQNFPPAGSYTSVLPAENSGGFDIYWYIEVNRLDGPGGAPEAYTGPPPRIFLTEGELS